MPIFRAGPKLVFFAHVPKCGGDSMARYLERRFGPVALLDRWHDRQPAAARWSRTSPQHMTGAQVARWFPPGFFDASFALVRHPVARIVSAYHFDLRTRSDGLIPFARWLDTALADLAADPTCRDGHLRPQVDFLPAPETVLFRLEDGGQAVIDWLDGICGETAPDLAFPHANRGKEDAATAAAGLVGPDELARIHQVYRADFDRFGYAPGLPDALPGKAGLGDRVLRRLGINWPP